MSTLPATLEEANTRILAYIELLKGQGHSEELSYNTAIEAFRKYKPYYSHLKSDICGDCSVCRYPVLHLSEEYAVNEVEMWHLECIKN
jgi:hypothetical protein